MKRPRRLRGLALGGATFVAVLTLGLAAMPTEQAVAEAPSAPARALSRIGAMNEKAALRDAQRRRAGAGIGARPQERDRSH